MATPTYTSKTLDHLGLVAGMCRELGIGEVIDTYCPSQSEEQIVSTGKVLEAMILNGLGFVNKRLYLVPLFFRDKPVELLLGKGLKTAHFNDDRLGRALDQLYDTGLTTLFTYRERKTLKRRVDKEAEEARKSNKKLSRQAFHHREDVLKAAEIWAN